MKTTIARLTAMAAVGAVASLLVSQALPPGQSPATRPGNVEGYKNTPLLPGTQWHVHDPDRPQPAVVTPPEKFSQGAAAPSDALVLFDGSTMDQWLNERGGPATAPIVNGAFTVERANGRLRTRDEFGDFQLHLEFATPAEVNPRQTGQGRGNNGLNIYGLYEVQILDSYENPTYPDGQAAAIYGQRPPLVNASKRPGEWQTYDLVWEGPRWDAEGKLLKKACVTLFHNGVLVHHRVELLGHTPHRQLPSYELGNVARREKGHLELFYHNNPVQFRNIWIRGIGVP